VRCGNLLLVHTHTLSFFLWCSSTTKYYTDLVVVVREAHIWPKSSWVFSAPPPHVPWTLYNRVVEAFFFFWVWESCLKLGQLSLFVSFVDMPPPHICTFPNRCCWSVCIYITYSKGHREASFHPSVSSFILLSIRSSICPVMVCLLWRGGERVGKGCLFVCVYIYIYINVRAKGLWPWLWCH